MKLRTNERREYERSGEESLSSGVIAGDFNSVEGKLLIDKPGPAVKCSDSIVPSLYYLVD